MTEKTALFLLSIAVCWHLILASGFLVMAGLAERLPVAPVPEEVPITPVRNDVVDHGRLDVAALLSATDAQRMSLQEAAA